MSSLYETLGGEAAIQATVDNFYVRVLADERINHFFEGVDMDRQKKHMRAFLTMALGGAKAYNGRGMEKAHRRLVKEHGLNDTHFGAGLENLGATLKSLGVADAHIAEAAGVAESVRDAVLGRSE